MASNPSKRVRAAAQRGGADGSRSKGFLERLGQNRTARKIAGPALIAAGLTSQFQADQTRDRKQMPPTAGLASPTSLARNAPPTARRSSAIDANGLRGAKPRPLSPGLDFGTRLASDQARDRHDAEENGEYDSNATGELADQEAGGSQRAFLEGAPQSYTSREKTDEQVEGARQAGMLETGRQFFPSGVERTPLEGEQTRVRRGSRPQESGGEDEDQDTRQPTPMQRAQEFQRQQLMDDLAQRDEAEGPGAAASAEQQGQALIKASKTVSNVVKGVQAAAAEGVIPLLTLIAQVNVEGINKWIFKKNLPFQKVEPHPKLDANDAVWGGINCCSCFLIFGGSCMPIIFGLALIAAAYSNKWEAFTKGIGALFAGLFH